MFELLPTEMVLKLDPDGPFKLQKYQTLSGFTPEITPVVEPSPPSEVSDAVSAMQEGKTVEFVTGRSCYAAFVVESTFVYLDLVYSGGVPEDTRKFAAELCDYMQTTYPDKDFIWVMKEEAEHLLEYVVCTDEEILTF